MKPPGTCICFFCFRKFDASEVVGVCTMCPQEVDAAIFNVFGVKEMFPRRFDRSASPGRGEMQGEILCPSGHPTIDVACPRCHADIELGASGSGEMLAIVGASESGKSTFVGALLNQILNHPERCFYDYAATMDGKSKEVFAKLRNAMYVEGRFPVATQKETQSLRRPIVSKLALPSPPRSWLDYFKPGSEQLVPLVFFDHPGESFTNPETPYVRYSAGAAGLMVAVDPTVLPNVEVRKDLSRRTPEEIRSKALDPNDMTRTLTDGVRKALRKPGGASVEVEKPAAILLLKADEIPAMAPVLEKMSAALPRGGKSRRFDAGFVDEIDAMCRVALEQWGGAATVAVASRAFRQVRLFPVVSAWRIPGSAQIDRTRAPLGVEEPLYWLLMQLGYFRI